MMTLASFLWDPLWKGAPFFGWQIFAVIALVVLIVFWVMYRRKQM